MHPPVVTMESIALMVAKYFDVSLADLKGESRKRAYAFPRQIAVFLIRDYFGDEKSYSMIGQWLGGRDHATISYAYKKIDKERRKDSELSARITMLQKKLRPTAEVSEEMQDIKSSLGLVDSDARRLVASTAFKQPGVLTSLLDQEKVYAVVAAFFSLPPNFLDLKLEGVEYCAQIIEFVMNFKEEFADWTTEEVDSILVTRIDELPDPLMRNDLFEVWELLLGQRQCLI